VSGCLLGQQVRYDGGHKKDYFLTGTLDPFVEFVPVCPELELGLGVPREPIHLEQRGQTVRLRTVKTGRDLTSAMTRFAEKRVAELMSRDLCGFVFKKDSPSCGIQGVKVYSEEGKANKSGRGLFARVLMEAHPQLPVEEEGRLQDARLRENFLERVFAYRRLKDFLGRRPSPGDWGAFHAREKLLLLSHDTSGYQSLGRLVANIASHPVEGAENYKALFMETLRKIATPGRHANVLQHMAGYLKRQLPPEDKQEIVEAIEDFRRGLTPLIVPVTLIRHHVRRHAVAYLLGQSYLDPHPKELMLRNHV
jgi:uncharacterized protein YbgA (DUF1722 family)/uncharacterized protein YbbK (DUF523 family)